MPAAAWCSGVWWCECEHARALKAPGELHSSAVAVALLFIDGVGVGRRDPATNPLAQAGYLLSRFEGEPIGTLSEGGTYVPVDATFGVPGRPQSASNQTALLTALPAPRLTGKHVLGYPDAQLRELLSQGSIVKRLVDAGRRVTFANAYPAGYLDALKLRRRPSPGTDVEIPPRALRRLKASATTLAMAAGGVELRTLEDARLGAGLTHDISGTRGRSKGFDVPLRSAEEAAGILLALAEEADFVLFEHYLADEAGHARDALAASDALSTFDAFARAVIQSRGSHHILICSDHGNVEDLSTRNHTLNPVPVLYFGSTPAAAASLETVADVGNVILSLLGIPAPGEAAR